MLGITVNVGSSITVKNMSEGGIGCSRVKVKVVGYQSVLRSRDKGYSDREGQNGERERKRGNRRVEGEKVFEPKVVVYL